MTHVSRPLIALLAGTVLFFGVWLVALKPGSSKQGGVGQYQSAINAAHNAVKPSQSAATTTPAVTTSAAARTTPALTPAASGAAAAAHRQSVVARALQAHKVVAMLFYNPAAADDRAVKRELATVPLRRGRVVKLIVPLSELSSYTIVTSQVPVGSSPTLVLVDRRQQASTIVGFADRFEIAQRVDDALAAR